jgi:hypothetical protein
MPNINQMMPSKYLKKEDVPQPALVTIRSFSQDNVAQQGQPEEKKWIMHFEEFENGLVMNSTNLQLCAMALSSEETDDWLGKQVVLFADPNVSFGGKLVGGLRIRARRRPAPVVAPARPAQRRPVAPPEYDDTDPGSLGGEFDDQP